MPSGTDGGRKQPTARPASRQSAAQRTACSGDGARTETTAASGRTASRPSAVSRSCSVVATARARAARSGSRRSSRRAARAAPAAAGARPVSKMKVRAALTRWSMTWAGPRTAPPWLPSDLDSVTVDDDVRRAREARRVRRAPAAVAEHAETVRVVDEQGGAELPAGGGESGQRGRVAVHREDRVGDDDGRSVVRAERLAHGVGVGVRDDLGGAAGEPAAVDERGVVARVGDDEGAVRGERGDGGEVGRVAGGEDERGLEAAEVGQLAFEFARAVRWCR